MRRFWAFMIMVVSLLVAVLFNVQAVVTSNNYSLEYQGGMEAVIQVDKRADGSNLDSDDISSRVMAKLDTAGARDSKVEVVMDSTISTRAQVRISISPNNTDEFNNILRVVEGNGPLTFSTADDFTIDGSSIFEDEDPMTLKYNETTPVPTFNISGTASWDQLVTHAKGSSEDETIQKTIYVWQNKTEIDTYEYGVGDKKRDDVAKKIIATLSTDNYNSEDENACYVSVSKDENGNDFTIASARSYVNARNTDDYGFDVKYLYENQITATYPEGSLRNCYIGIGISLGIMLVGLVLLYGISGGVATLSIAVSVLFEMMIANFLGFEFSPITIAGVLISVVLGVFISINYFQKVKGEIRKGKSIDTANTEGYRKSFATTWQSCLLVFFLALFAFLIGKGVIRSFAGVIIVGSITDFIFVNYLNKWMTYWITTSSVFSKEGRTFGLSEKNNGVEKVFATKEYAFAPKTKKRTFAYLWTLVGICLLVTGSFLTFGLKGGVTNFFNSSNEYQTTARVNVSYVLDRNVTDDKKFTTFTEFENYITDSTIFEDHFTKDQIISSNFNQVETLSNDTKDSYLNSVETYTYYISFEVSKSTPTLNTKIESISNAFSSDTNIYDVEYIDDVNVTITDGNTKYIAPVTNSKAYSSLIEHNNFWLYLTLGLTIVFTLAFYLIVYGLYAAIAVTGIEAAEFGLVLGLLSISRLPFNSTSLFGLFVALFVTSFTLIPVFARYRELKKDSKVKHPDMALKTQLFNESMKDSISTILIPHACLVVFGIFVAALNYSTNLTLGLTMIVGGLASALLIFLFLAALYLTASKIAVKSPEKLAKLALKRKPIEVNKNEPHETIIPGIND